MFDFTLKYEVTKNSSGISEIQAEYRKQIKCVNRETGEASTIKDTVIHKIKIHMNSPKEALLYTLSFFFLL